MPRRTRVINPDTYTTIHLVVSPRMKRCIKAYMDQHGIKFMKEVVRIALMKLLEPCLEDLPKPRVVSEVRGEDVERILGELEFLHAVRKINELGKKDEAAEEIDFKELEEWEARAVGEEDGGEGGEEG